MTERQNPFSRNKVDLQAKVREAQRERKVRDEMERLLAEPNQYTLSFLRYEINLAALPPEQAQYLRDMAEQNVREQEEKIDRLFKRKKDDDDETPDFKSKFDQIVYVKKSEARDPDANWQYMEKIELGRSEFRHRLAQLEKNFIARFIERKIEEEIMRRCHYNFSEYKALTPEKQMDLRRDATKHVLDELESVRYERRSKGYSLEL